LLLDKILTQRLLIPKQKLKTILNKVEVGEEKLCNLIMIYFNEAKDESISNAIQILKIALFNKNEEYVLKFRSMLSEQKNGKELLFEEYLGDLRNSTNKTEFFWMYFKSTLIRIDNYKKEYYIKCVKEYLKTIEGSSSYSNACNDLLVLVIQPEIELGNKLDTQIVEGCERLISINKTYEEQEILIKNLENIKQNKNIETKPDRISLLKFIKEFNKVDSKEDIRKLLQESYAKFQGIDILEYENVLENFLTKALTSVNDWNTHAIIKKIFCDDKRKALFFAKYVEIIVDNINQNSEFTKIFSDFIVYIFNASSTDNENDEETYIQVRTNITNSLYRLDSDQLKEINALLLSSLSGMRNKENIQNQWNKIYSKFESQIKNESKGFFGKFKK
jgi:hypothetical protein